MNKEQRRQYQNEWARNKRKQLREDGYITIHVLVKRGDEKKVRTFAEGLINTKEQE